MSANRATGVGMVLLSLAVAALTGNPAQAADWDTSIADSRASGTFQEFDLGSTISSNETGGLNAGIAGGVASSGASGVYGNAPGTHSRPA